MIKKIWEQWGIPLVIGLVLLIAGLYLNCWATGVPLRPPFTGGWIKSLLSFPVHMPLWMLLAVIAITVVAWFYSRRRSLSRSMVTDRSEHRTDTALRQTISAIPAKESSLSTIEVAESSALTSSDCANTLHESVIHTSDDYLVRIQPYASQSTHGLTLTIDNNRLGGIYQVRVIISKARSYDSRHRDFRDSFINAVVMSSPDVIAPGLSGKPFLLVRKEPNYPHLFAGDSFRFPLPWPTNDKSPVHKWNLDFRVQVALWPPSPPGGALKELFADFTFLWDPVANEFSIERPSVSMPPTLPAFPAHGEDGVHRTTVRFMKCGLDQLMAYTTTRDGFPGTRYLVVRNRPGLDPQSVEAADKSAANAQWTEWYREQETKGFGGWSGNCLDGKPPF
jgi:hypothetical protein